MGAKNVSIILVVFFYLVAMTYGSDMTGTTYGSYSYMTGTASTTAPAPLVDLECPQFRTSDLTDTCVAIAGNAIWKGDSTCGQKFKITCIGSVNDQLPCPCKPGASVVVMIVDHCLAPLCDVTHNTFILSAQPFNAITIYPNPNITISYERVY